MARNKLETAAKLVGNASTAFGSKKSGADFVRAMSNGRKLSTAGLRRKAAHLKAAGKTAEAKMYQRGANLRTAGNIVKNVGLVGAGAGGVALINARSNRKKDRAARIASEAR